MDNKAQMKKSLVFNIDTKSESSTSLKNLALIKDRDSPLEIEDD